MKSVSRHLANGRIGGAGQRGVGLLEVLIAVLVMAVGMLGIAALQAVALRNSQSSFERSNAVVQSYAILDAMRANAAAARIGQYDRGMICELPDEGDLVETDLRNWITSLHQSLGDDACGQTDCDSVSCTVTVQWNDSRSKDAGDDGEDKTQTVTVETRI